jgi:carbon storage regulator CsrA
VLTLTLKAGERVFVGDNVIVKVYEVRPGGYVRLAFEAPRAVPVNRQAKLTLAEVEEYERKAREGR